MRKTALVLLNLFFLWALTNPAAGAEVQPAGPPWKELAPGLSFYRWPVQSGSQVLDVITILRIKPEDYYDVIGLSWSFDGRHLALEAHSADLSDSVD